MSKLGQRRPDLAYAAKMLVLLAISLPATCILAHGKEHWAWDPALSGIGFFVSLGAMCWAIGYFLFNSYQLDDEWRRTRRCKTCGAVPRSTKRNMSIKLECKCGTRYIQSAWRHFQGEW